MSSGFLQVVEPFIYNGVLYEVGGIIGGAEVAEIEQALPAKVLPYAGGGAATYGNCTTTGVSPIQAPLRLSNIATILPVPIGGGFNVGSNGGQYTLTEIWNVETDFDAVRLVYPNDGAAYAIGGALAAPIQDATVYSPYDDQSATVKGITPVIATFNNAGAPTTLAVQESTQYGATVTTLTTAAGTSVLTSLSYSDWMQMTALPRLDKGPGRLVTTRTVIESGATARGPQLGEGIASQPTNVFDVNPAPYTGRFAGTLFVQGDYVTGTTTGLSASGKFITVGGNNANAAYNAAQVYALQAVLRVPGIQVGLFGDSIDMETGSGNGITGWCSRACAAVSTEELPIHLAKVAVWSEPSAEFVFNAMKAVSSFGLSVAFIPLWTGNDPITQAGADGAFQRAIAIGAACRAAGCIPVYRTAVPQATRCTTAALDAFRLSSCTRGTQLANAGEYVIDFNAILGNGASPVDYAAPYLFDHFHPNDAGQNVLAQAAEVILRNIISTL